MIISGAGAACAGCEPHEGADQAFIFRKYFYNIDSSSTVESACCHRQQGLRSLFCRFEATTKLNNVKQRLTTIHSVKQRQTTSDLDTCSTIILDTYDPNQLFPTESFSEWLLKIILEVAFESCSAFPVKTPP